MSEYVSARKAEEEKAAKERRKYNVTVGIVVACVVLVLVFVILFDSNLFYNGTTALKIGDQKYTVADFNYNYYSTYNSYYNSVTSSYGSSQDVMSMFLPSTQSPFRDQAYFGGDSDTTWADYFEDAAIERMKNSAALCAAAKAEGYELTQEDLDEIDSSIASLTESVVAGGYKDLDAYLAVYYGKGSNEKVFRENIERDYLASNFSQYKNDSFTFTADEIAAHYSENADDYDYFNYRLYSFSGTAVTDDEDTEEDETMSAEDASAKAQADAEAYLAAVTDEQSFIDYAASLNADNEDYDGDAATIRHTQGSSLADALKDWMTDPARKAGDVEVLKTGEDAATPYVYVAYFLDRDTNRYNAVSGYYGLVTESADTEEGSEETAQEKATLQAQEVKADYDALTEKGYDAFVDLMADSSDLVTSSSSITSAGRYSLPDKLSDWFMDESRAEGDVDVVYVDGYGAFVVYFSGVDGVYGDMLSEADLRNEAYADWEDSAVANYQDVEKGWQMGLSKKITALGG